jgi:hypothetical protein
MKRGRLPLRLLIAGGMVAGACTDAPSVPVARETIGAPLATSRIAVPARLPCSAKGAGSPFRFETPRFNLTSSADSLVVDSTAAYEAWDPSEEPAAEFSEYYDPFSGDRCWDVYMQCIVACKKLPKKVDRAICYVACMDWYSGCVAEKYLPPSLQPCGTVTRISYDPESPDCDPYGDPSEGTSGDGGASGGDNCHDEYIVVEISYDDGVTWHKWWEGWASVCG